MNFKKTEIAATVFAFAVFLSLWEIISGSVISNINLFPPPSVIWETFLESLASGEYTTDVSVSMGRVMLGFLIGGILGITLGVLTGRIEIMRMTVGQIANFLRHIPSIALVPLAIVWFGITDTSKIFLIVSGVLFPVWINTHQGMIDVDKRYVWAIKSLGAKKIQTLKEVVFPNAMQFIITGLRIGISLGFLTLVAAEIAGAFSGVGYRISASHLIFRTDKMILAIVTLGILGLLSDKIFIMVVKKIFPWVKVKG